MSRCHSTIRYSEGEYYLNDNASKFGTLVVLPEKTVIDPEDSPVCLQAGRTTLTFEFQDEAKKSKKKCSGCFSHKEPVHTKGPAVPATVL